MEYYFLLALLCLGSVTAQGTVRVPLKFTMTDNSIINAGDTQYFTAALSCSNLTTATITVCAELPNNWMWNPYRGLVYLNIYNNSADAFNFAKTSFSTGTPNNPLPQTPDCFTITSWPGGDMYIRVDPNNYSPVSFTVNAKIIYTKMPDVAESPKYSVQRIRPPARSLSTGAAVTSLTPAVIFGEDMQLVYDQEVTVQVDLCLAPHTGSNLALDTTLLAKAGTFTFVVCRSLPCTIDSPFRICIQPSPLPAGTCSAGVDDLNFVYITIHAAGGQLINNQYVGLFRLGAILSGF